MHLLNISITFDYELFLGENHCSEEEVLFKPTEKLLDMLKKQNITSTFFVDVCSVFQYEKYGLDEYCKAFEDQLLKMNEHRQDVQLHIHSNWFNSTYENGAWNLSSDGYRIHSYGFDESSALSAPSIIRRGKLYLEELIKRQDKSYKCIAYRAGGFCIQPENDIVRILKDYGILIDSSVAMNMKNSGTNGYDFTDVPDQLNWWFSSDSGLRKVCSVHNEHKMLEIPIVSVKNNLLRRLLTPRKKRFLPELTIKGLYVKQTNEMLPFKKSLLSRIISYNDNYSVLSLDLMNYQMLYDHLLRLYKNHNCSKNDKYISIICHPKLLNETLLENINHFICAIKQYPEKFRFCSMNDIYDSIMNEEVDEH